MMSYQIDFGSAIIMSLLFGIVSTIHDMLLMSDHSDHRVALVFVSHTLVCAIFLALFNLYIALGHVVWAVYRAFASRSLT